MKVHLNTSPMAIYQSIPVQKEKASESEPPFVTNSSFDYYIGSAPKAEVSIPLSVPREIAFRLVEKGMVVVYGAHASGKSEQMELAIPSDQTEVFDLPLRFAEAYGAKTGRDIKAVSREYLLNGSPEQKILRSEQKLWLREKQEFLIKELASSDKKTIVFDEIDFAGESYFLNADETDALLSIAQIGDRLKKLGKQVVFIVRAAANRCDPFLEMLQETFHYEKKDIVKTRFFTHEEEIYLLSQTSLTLPEKQEFLAFAQGSPTAYLPVLKKKPDLNIQLLKEQALMMSSLVIKQTKHTNPPHIWDLLLSIVQGNLSLETITDPDLVQNLLSSSFVGQKEGRLVMAEFAKTAFKNLSE